MPELIRIEPLELRFLRRKHDSGGSLHLFEMTVPHSGRALVSHYHRDWDETVYGFTGAVTFTVDGVSHAVGPGESLFISPGVVHGSDKRSGATATCLCVLTPGVLGPDFFREVAALLVAGPPDAAKMREIMLRHGLVPA